MSLEIENGPRIGGKQTQLRPLAPSDYAFFQTLWPEIAKDGTVTSSQKDPTLLADSNFWEKQLSESEDTRLLIETPNNVPLGTTGWGAGNPGQLSFALSPNFLETEIAHDALSTLLTYIWTGTSIQIVYSPSIQETPGLEDFYRDHGFDSIPIDPDPTQNQLDRLQLTRPQRHSTAGPTTLIFDWGGVLMRTKDDSGRRYWERELGLERGASDRAVFGSEAWRQAQHGQLSPDACWDRIGKSLDLDATQLAQFRADFWAGDLLNRDLLTHIHRWKAQGYRIALLSNFTTELDDFLPEDIRREFNPIVVSAKEGVLKPASWIFWRVLNRMKIPPASAIMIDDFIENISGAACVGLHTVHFRNTLQAVSEIESVLV